MKISTVFKPIVDNHMRRNPLVPVHPDTFDQSVVSRSIPLMIGSSKDEGLSSSVAIYLNNQARLTSPESVKKDVLPKLMKSLLGPTRGSRQELLEAAFRQYFSDIHTGSMEELITALGEMLGDVLVNSCIRETILLHRHNPASPVFSYVFAHSGCYYFTQLMEGVKNIQRKGEDLVFTGRLLHFEDSYSEY